MIISPSSDERELLRVMVKTFDLAEVKAFSSTEEAGKQISQGDKTDLIIIDYNALTGKKSVQELQELREEHSFSLICLTDTDSPRTMAHLREISPFIIMGKPVDPFQLEENIRSLFRFLDGVKDLRENEKALRIAFDQSNDAIIWAEAETGIIVECNRSAEHLLDRTREEIIGLHQSKIHPEPERKSDRDHFKNAELYNPPDTFIDVHIQRPDGSLRSVEIVSTVFKRHGVSMVQGVFRDVTFRKEMDRQLKEDEELFRTIAESSHIYLFLFQDGELIFVNDALCRAYGYERDEMIGADFQKLHEMLHPDDRETALREFALLESGQKQSSRTHLRVINKNGHLLNVDHHARIVDFRGKPAHLVTQADLTAVLETGQRLMMEQERLSAIIHSSPDGIIVADRENITLRCNRMAAQLHGYDHPDELMGVNTLELIHPEDRELFMRNGMDLINGEGLSTVTISLLRKDGTSFPAEMSLAVLREQEEITGFLGIARDVSIKHRTFQELKESNERFRLLYDNAPMAYLVMDDRGTITRANHAARTLLKYSEEEFLDIGIEVLFSDNQGKEDRGAFILNYIQEGEQIEQEETWLYDREGNRVSVLLSLSTIIEPDTGRVRECYLTLEDITDRKQVEEHLYQAKLQADAANQAKSLFLSKVSHELRTPLNAILGFGQILEQEAGRDLTDVHRSYLNDILQGGNQLLEMIEKILDYTRLESGSVRLSRAPFDLPLMINRLVAELKPRARECRQVLTINQDETIRWIYADEEKVKHALRNILTNAIQYSREGNKIHVQCKALDNRAVIDIQNNGSPIPAEKREEIFAPFEQLERRMDNPTPGYGLGLPLARRIAELHDGSLDLIDSQGEGNTFRMILPGLFSQEQSQTHDILEGVLLNRENYGSPYQILLVDGNLQSSKQIEEGLRQAGYKVDRAESGESAFLKIIREKYDLIIIASTLPGMDSAETLNRIRTTDHVAVPVIAITDDRNSTENSLRLGFDSYVTRPVNLSSLTSRILHLLERGTRH